MQVELVHEGISIKHQFKSPAFLGLEALLNRSGFADKDVAELSSALHEVGHVFESCLQNPIDRMLDDVFQLPPDASVIIDEVPPLYDDLKSMRS